jgi:ankyrin repeat protein
MKKENFVNNKLTKYLAFAILLIWACCCSSAPIEWPLNQAIVKNDIHLLKTILDKGVSSKELGYALAAAAGRDNVEAARILLKKGADPNYREPILSRTPLHIAARENNVAVLSYLLQNKGDPNAKDKLGWATIHMAIKAEYEYLEIIEILVKAGADINIVDSYGRTALHRAAIFGKINSVLLLLKLGADSKLIDKRGMTPRDRALANGHNEIANLLM